MTLTEPYYTYRPTLLVAYCTMRGLPTNIQMDHAIAECPRHAQCSTVQYTVQICTISLTAVFTEYAYLYIQAITDC
jgi:hypothetical protein